ncbi:MAG: glycosyltransferase [Muribaculaceae bacterium]|nr:glycosyltransferase [Muribaculaceae bacterium]
MPEISVIIPVFNMRDTVERSVESVLAQSFRGFELILVDDGSTDGSGVLCDKLNGNDSRLRVIHTENHGVSAARKAGVAVSKGNWVMFVDADDTLPNDSLQLLLERAKGEVDIVAGNAKCYSSAGVHALNRETSLSLTGMEFADLLLRSVVSDKISGLLLRRSLIDLGSWLTSKAVTPCEDRIILLRASIKAQRVVVDNSIYVYEYHDDYADEKRSTIEMTAEAWESFFDRLHHLFDTVEPLSQGFYLFRLRQFYSGIILPRLKFNGGGEAKRLKAEARNHKLCGHDKIILRMLRDPIYRRLWSNKFAPPSLNERINVGVVIYARNSRRRILKAINKALHLTMADNLEVVVVDNASTDNTVEIVKSVRAINPRVHLVTFDEPVSLDECRLAGLRQSISEKVLLTTTHFITRNNGVETLLSIPDNEDETDENDIADIVIGDFRRRSRLLSLPLSEPQASDDEMSVLQRLLRRLDLLYGTENILYRRTTVGETLVKRLSAKNDETEEEKDFKKDCLNFNMAVILSTDRRDIKTDKAGQVATLRDRKMSARAIKGDYSRYCDAALAALYMLKEHGIATEDNCRAIADGLSRRLFSTLSLLLASPLFPTEKARIWLETAFNHEAWKILEPLLPDNIAVLYKSNDVEAIIVQALNGLHSQRLYYYSRRLL